MTISILPHPTSTTHHSTLLRRVLPALALVATSALLPLQPETAAAATARPSTSQITHAEKRSPALISITGGTKKERAAVRALVKKWATHTHITQIVLRRGTSFWGRTTLRPTGHSDIVIRSGLSTKNLRYTVAHEVAHSVQGFVYRQVGVETMKARMRAVFGGQGSRGADNAADCAAHALTGRRSTVYKSNCSRKQLAAASRFMAGRRV